MGVRVDQTGKAGFFLQVNRAAGKLIGDVAKVAYSSDLAVADFDELPLEQLSRSRVEERSAKNGGALLRRSRRRDRSLREQQGLQRKRNEKG